MFTIGKYNTMFCIILTLIFLGHDEDLEAGRIMRFTKEAKWYSHHKFQHYYSFILVWIVDFQLGNYYRFPSNETLFEKKFILWRIQKTCNSLDNINDY